MRILAVTGSSGGHIFPAIAFLEAAKERRKDIELRLVLPESGIGRGRKDFPCKVYLISAPNVSLNIGLRNIAVMLGFLIGIFQSAFILLEFRPDIVVGFGSAASVPLVLLSWVLRIKVLIHEQNVMPGKANRLLSWFSDKIAVSFKETEEHFRDIRERVVYTGNPLRSRLSRCDKNKALGFFGLTDNKFTVLVVGGSQGSRNINRVFSDMLLESSLAKDLQAIHISGVGDYDFLKARYNGLGTSVRLFKFLDCMEYAYSACDFVVSRAGATTIAEIIHFGLAAIIVPYPFAHKHQMNNAKALEARGPATIIDDNRLDTGILEKGIRDFMAASGKSGGRLPGYTDTAGRNTNVLFTDAVLSLA